VNIFEQAMDLCRGHDFHIGPDGCGPTALLEKLEAAGLFRDDHPDEGEVMAVRATGNNADLIADAFRLGYLTDEMEILDPTYGMGVFWKKHRPPFLIGTDLDPTKSPGGATPRGLLWYQGMSCDFTDTGWNTGLFDAVAFDPDYKLQGTSSNAGPASSNGRYGMDREYRSVEEQYGVIGKGLTECVRVTKPGGMVLVKYMSQVVSGAVQWMEIDIPMAMEQLGCRYIDDLRLIGYRKQPTHDKCKTCDGGGTIGTGCKGECGDPTVHIHFAPCEKCGGEGKVPRRQVHARRNYSVLGIFEKGKA
jgi:hypothetical protein